MYCSGLGVTFFCLSDYRFFAVYTGIPSFQAWMYWFCKHLLVGLLGGVSRVRAWNFIFCWLPTKLSTAILYQQSHFQRERNNLDRLLCCWLFSMGETLVSSRLQASRSQIGVGWKRHQTCNFISIQFPPRGMLFFWGYVFFLGGVPSANG